MKILIYQPRLSYYVGGGEVYPLQTAKFFSSLNNDVTILTTKADYIKQSDYFVNFVKQNPGIKIEYLTLDENFRNIYNEEAGMSLERWDRESLWVARLAYEFLSKNKYDIITVHYVLDALAVPFNCKYVLHLHGVPNEISYLCKLVLEKQNNLIAVSQTVKQKWIELGAKLPIKISTNAIDESVFTPIKKDLKSDNILFVGRLIEIKGVQYILEALKLLEQKGLQPKLKIIGDGPYRQTLENLTNSLGLSQQVEFCGRVQQRDLIYAYQTAKIAVLPSFEKEGIMSTLLEASSCGTPCITTRGTSMEEFAQNNKNALLIEPHNSVDLCDKIYQLLTNSKMQEQIVQNAQKEIQKNFTWLAKAKELLSIYKEFCDDKIH